MSSHWQEALLQSLEARDAREQAYVPFVQQYQRAAQSTATLKERNDVLLTAAKTARSISKGKEAAAGSGDENPVRAAYVTSLEAQIASLKEELAGLYRTQSQNAQRLLALSDSLRDTEDKARDESDHGKQLRQDLDRTSRRCHDLEASLKDKEKIILNLNDELQTNQLEFGQLEQRNKDLVKDNKALLQRWLDRMQQEVHSVNEANAFIESTRKQPANGRSASRSRAASRSSSPTRSATGRKTPTSSSATAAATRSTKSKVPPPSKLPT